MHHVIIGNSQQIAAELSLTLVLAVFLTILRPSRCREVKFSLTLGLRPNLGLRLLS